MEEERDNNYNSFSEIKSRTDETKNIMIENINKIVENNQISNNLVNDTNNLIFETLAFNRKVSENKRRMILKFVGICVIIAIILIMFFIILFLLILLIMIITQ